MKNKNIKRKNQITCQTTQYQEHRRTVTWPEALEEHESERPDKLLLSSLTLWEVERDLIEERLGRTSPVAVLQPLT